MSFFNKNPIDETWYVHAPQKIEKCTTSVPPPSNIPYLNGVVENDSEIPVKGMWFRNTDSEFIKLSKLGGQPDLLVHKDITRRREPVTTPMSQWWTDMLLPTAEELQKIEENKQKEIKFEVPDWFMHHDKADRKVPQQKRVHKLDFKNIEKRNFKIEEPVKYGQLRNYLHPIKK